jgi:hypothetical protein
MHEQIVKQQAQASTQGLKNIKTFFPEKSAWKNLLVERAKIGLRRGR